MAKQMIERDVADILAAVETLRRQKGLSRRQLSKTLDIPFNTFRAWFQQKSSKTPSKANALKLKRFLDESIHAGGYWERLWETIREWWRIQHRYGSSRELAEEIGWNAEDLRSSLEDKLTPPRLVIERCADLLHLTTPPAALSAEAKRKANRMKALLTILEEELAWFRDSPPEARETYRLELDPFDVGYVSSLLTMMFSEEKFRRWLQVTTNRFKYFKGKGAKR